MYIIALVCFRYERSSHNLYIGQHRALDLCLTGTEFANDINDFENNTIVLALGPDAQKYAVVRTSFRIPQQSRAPRVRA